MKKGIFFILFGLLLLPALSFSNEVEPPKDISFLFELSIVRILSPSSTIQEYDCDLEVDLFDPMNKEGDRSSRGGDEEPKIGRRGHRIRRVTDKRNKKIINPIR